ncbi:unnamed protein product [Schistosoma bovis]|nr:unnamed protein product [Schistosoma bovis]
MSINCLKMTQTSLFLHFHTNCILFRFLTVRSSLSLCCQTFYSRLTSYTTYVNISSTHHTRSPFKAFVLVVVHACRATFFVAAVCSTLSDKMLSLWPTDLHSSVHLLGHQDPTSTRHLGRLTPVLHRPAEPSTSDFRQAAARPTAPPHRQHPLQSNPLRQNTPLSANPTHQTASTSTSAPGPQWRPQNTAWDNRTHLTQNYRTG